MGFSGLDYLAERAHKSTYSKDR